MTRDELVQAHKDSIALESTLRKIVGTLSMSDAGAAAVIDAWSAQKRVGLTLARAVQAVEAVERRSTT